MSSVLVPIGAIVRAHGVRGVVRVRLFDAESDALGEVKRVFVGPEQRELRLEMASRDRDGMLVKLGGLDDRDAAEALRGQLVQVRRDELPPLEDDEIYVTDLVGCELVDLSGVVIGQVRRVDTNGVQELLVVERDDGGEALVPFVEPIILSVDLDGRRIACELPEGLLDLDRAGASGRPGLSVIDGDKPDDPGPGDGAKR